MTLFELSLRNAKRQARDYLIYFVTVVMAAALLYAFNGLVFSQEIRKLSSGMATLPIMIALASIVVVCIFGWLVSYSTRFMLSRRSRELGTYILIGLENKQVARLFFLENLAVGGCALALGVLLGGLLYQALRAIVLALFGMAYQFSFGLSLPAMGLTASYFALIYLNALRKSRKSIRRMKICDLIYFDRQNEGAVVQTSKKRRVLFVLSILLGAAGTVLMMTPDWILGLIGAGCVIVFLFGFFLSFASGVPAFFDKRPARKFKGQSLLVFRTLTAKLATMGVLMATISMIFTATLISEGTGLVFRGIFEGRAAESACFDLYIGINGEQPDFGEYLDYVGQSVSVESPVLYRVYQAENAQVMDYLDAETDFYHFGYERDAVLRYSDYAALRAIAGYPPVVLEPGHYLIHGIAYLEEAMKNYRAPLTLEDTTLTPGGVYTEHFLQLSTHGNGNRYILIVPDEAVEGLEVHHCACAARTAQPVPAKVFYSLTALADQNSLGWDIATKAYEEAEVATQTALLVFPLYFLALALTMTAATILTIQQLSEAERYRRQFELLRKLGMDRRDMAAALRNQFAIYYAMPAVPAVLIGVPFILNLANLPEPGVMVMANSPTAITCVALGLFFLIYAVYILLAYSNLRRSVLPE